MMPKLTIKTGKDESERKVMKNGREFRASLEGYKENEGHIRVLCPDTGHISTEQTREEDPPAMLGA